MDNQEFKGLTEIKVNDTVYVSKDELLDLIRDEKRKCMEGTEPGYMNPKKKQRIAAMLSLNHLAVLIKKREYDGLHEIMFRWLVAGDGWSGVPEANLVYLEGFCKHVPERDGQPVPVFGSDPKGGLHFDTREDAQDMITQIHTECPRMNIVPVQVIWTMQKFGLRNIHAILGWPGDREPEDVLKAELELGRAGF